MYSFLITGGAGFVGSKLSNYLVECGYRVRVLDNLSTGNIKNLKENNKLEIIIGDIRDYKTCLSYTRQIDYVIHLAAIATVVESIEKPINTNLVNINGSINVLEAAKQNNVARVVLASSSAVYGQLSNQPACEDYRVQPLSPYGISKHTAEQYASYYYEQYNLETVSLRFFNIYGPGRLDKIKSSKGKNSKGGEGEIKSADVISMFLNCVIQPEKKAVIYGSGKQSRDFIFIDDVIKAIILACNSRLVGRGEVINIASGREISINNLLGLIEVLTDSTIRPVYCQPRSGDIDRMVADTSLAKDLLGFKTEIDLESGLIQTLNLV